MKDPLRKERSSEYRVGPSLSHSQIVQNPGTGCVWGGGGGVGITEWTLESLFLLSGKK